MGKIKLLLLGILLVVIGFGIYFIQNPTEIKKYLRDKPKQVKSDFKFTTIENKIIHIDVSDRVFNIRGMENKIVFLKVFGWECNFCKKEIPELIKLKKELGDSFEVVAIEAQQHSVEESKSFMKQHGINYHIIQGDNQAEFYNYLQDKYAWSGVIPLTIVVGNHGKVLAFEVGAKSYSLSELIQASLLRK